MAKLKTITLKVNPRDSAGGVKIIYNRLLGAWYVVRGPHHTPISGAFPTKFAAEAWLSARTATRNPARKAKKRRARSAPPAARRPKRPAARRRALKRNPQTPPQWLVRVTEEENGRYVFSYLNGANWVRNFRRAQKFSTRAAAHAAGQKASKRMTPAMLFAEAVPYV